MKTTIYTHQQCLEKAKRAIAQIDQEGTMVGLLVYAAARTWLERAEFARRSGKDEISSSDFELVHESLDPEPAPNKQICLTCGTVTDKDLCPQCGGDSLDTL